MCTLNTALSVTRFVILLSAVEHLNSINNTERSACHHYLLLLHCELPGYIFFSCENFELPRILLEFPWVILSKMNLISMRKQT